MSDVNNSENIIDSRDVIKRIEELESDRVDLASAVGEAGEALENAAAGTRKDFATALSDASKELREWDEENGHELKSLKSLAEDAAGYSSDWRHGATLIRDGYFERYAEQLAGDIGAVNADAAWPLNHIDWEAAAEELKQDYTSVDFDGTDYWVR